MADSKSHCAEPLIQCIAKHVSRVTRFCSRARHASWIASKIMDRSL